METSRPKIFSTPITNRTQKLMELRTMKVKMMFRRNPKKVQPKVEHLKNSSMKTQRITI